LIGAGDVFVATTVLLETEWVLRSGYGYAPGPLIEALRSFSGLPGLSLEDPQLAARALNLAEQGLDFADALHLERAAGCSDFVSFDRKLVRAAARVGAIKVAAP
jgi:predicted nucleic-acid-binding protein